MFTLVFGGLRKKEEDERPDTKLTNYHLVLGKKMNDAEDGMCIVTGRQV